MEGFAKGCLIIMGGIVVIYLIYKLCILVLIRWLIRLIALIGMAFM